MVEKVDVLIVGGGLIGMALMRALVPLGFDVRLAEAHAIQPTTPTLLDTRSIALSPASLQILKQLGVWSELQEQAAWIRQIHVSEQGHLGQARLDSADMEEPLGAVVEMHVLGAALHQSLDQQAISSPARLVDLNAETGEATLETATGQQDMQAKWVIAADGANSSVRKLCGVPVDEKLYPEHALAANIALARPHNNIAYERFTAHGPLALLPLPKSHMALVWTCPKEQALRLQEMGEADFLTALQRAFGYRAGRFTAVGQRQVYPLKQVMMPEQVHHRVIFVGNAAHTLHPVAGQGFNLGLRDVAMLAQCAATYGLTDAASAAYQAARRSDQRTITRATDHVVSLFKSRLPGVGLARRLGLVALDQSELLKRMLLRQAKGFGGVVPDLVCGIPLEVS